MDDLIDEKAKIVLNLIRTNNTADDVQKITQALLNISHAKSNFQQLFTDKSGKTKGASA